MRPAPALAARQPAAPAPAPAATAVRRRTRRALGGALLWLGAGGCVGNPASEISQAELLLGISDAVEALRAENAFLQEQVDSLQLAVARQDTLLRRMAAVTGVPVAGP